MFLGKSCDWIEFIWLRIGTDGGLPWTFLFHWPRSILLQEISYWYSSHYVSRYASRPWKDVNPPSPLPRGSKPKAQRCYLEYSASSELSSFAWAPLCCNTAIFFCDLEASKLVTAMAVPWSPFLTVTCTCSPFARGLRDTISEVSRRERSFVSVLLYIKHRSSGQHSYNDHVRLAVY
jgi:hypothetical protein